MANYQDRDDCEEMVPNNKDPKYVTFLEKEPMWFEWFQLMKNFFGNEDVIMGHLERMKKNLAPLCNGQKCWEVQMVKNLQGDHLERFGLGVDKNRLILNNNEDGSATRQLQDIYDFVKKQKYQPDYWLINTVPDNYYNWYLPYYLKPKVICSYQDRFDETQGGYYKSDQDLRWEKIMKQNAEKTVNISVPKKISIATPVTGPNGMIIGRYNSDTKIFEPFVPSEVLSMKDVPKISEDMKWLRKSSVQSLNRYLDKKIPSLRASKMDVYPPIYKEMTDKFFQKDLKTPEYF